MGEVADDLAKDLAAALCAERIDGLQRLTGGASRETWRFDAVDANGGVQELILRRDPPERPSPPGAMGLEAACISAAAAAGLAVPEVVLATDGPELWGSAGIVMRRVEAETLPRRILRDDEYLAARDVLAIQCGEFLAGLHAIDPETIPGLPDDDPLTSVRDNLEMIGEPSPTFELALRWLEANRPPPTGRVIVHGDFRLGNLMVGEDGLRAVLDWELVHIGDPVEDLGWLCTRAWRFGARPPVGGFGAREDLLTSYRQAGGAQIDLDVLRWWEVLNTLKWGMICMAQASIHLTGVMRSVELAAIGRRVCEQEWDLLLLLADEDIREQVERPAEVADPPGLHGRPTAMELLDAVEGFLRDEVMPSTTGRLSFHARVAANVLAIVGRELASSASPYVAADLVSAIRAGEWDDRLGELTDRLTRDVAAKLAVANPKYF